MAGSTDDPILISGGSGFIGSALARQLQAAGQRPLVLSRRPDPRAAIPMLGYDQLDTIKRCRAIVNLAGGDIAGGRWTAARRSALRRGRLCTTVRLSEWAASLAEPPACFVSASAIGYYGATGENAATEEDPAGAGFGAELCADWEAAVTPPAATRRVILRIGIVLGAGGGALRRMLPAFRLGLGGPIGDGRQWMSWIALDDLLSLVGQALDDPRFAGVYNAVAPDPVRNAEFAAALGAALRRPARLRVPATLLKLALGEMSTLLLDSQRVVPARLQAAGFAYAHPNLDAALTQALIPTGRD